MISKAKSGLAGRMHEVDGAQSPSDVSSASWLQVGQLKPVVSTSTCCVLQAWPAACRTSQLKRMANSSEDWESAPLGAPAVGWVGRKLPHALFFPLGFSQAECAPEILTDFHDNAKFKTHELCYPQIPTSILKYFFIQYYNKHWKVFICLLLSKPSGNIQYTHQS